MSEKMWYYVKENKQEGPVPQSKMHEMFNAGILGPATLIWSDDLPKWTPAFKVETFLVKDIPSTPPLPKQEPPAIPSLSPLSNMQGKEVSQVRPWVRYWARMFDICLFSLPAGFALALISHLIFPPFMNVPESLYFMLLIFIWIFVEAYLLSTWGSTPGKSLLKITLRTSTGEKLSFSNALNRSFSVWWRGLGTGFPIASLITLYVAYKNLSRDSITSWDDEGNFVISHNRIGFLRVIVVVLFFIGFVWIFKEI